MLDVNFFYFLGYIFGRGRIQPNRIRLSIRNSDNYLFYQFKELICAKSKIYIGPRRTECIINNKKFIGKVLKYNPPTSKAAEPLLFISSWTSHFIRGLFDSSGRIFLHKNKYLNVTLTSYSSLISSLRDFLYSLDISSKIFFRYSHTNTSQMLITKHDDCLRFCEFVYSNLEQIFYLTRKFDIFNSVE